MAAMVTGPKILLSLSMVRTAEMQGGQLPSALCQCILARHRLSLEHSGRKLKKICTPSLGGSCLTILNCQAAIEAGLHLSHCLLPLGRV